MRGSAAAWRSMAWRCEAMAGLGGAVLRWAGRREATARQCQAARSYGEAQPGVAMLSTVTAVPRGATHRVGHAGRRNVSQGNGKATDLKYMCVCSTGLTEWRIG
jgi:hypothetical protein